MKKMFRLSNLLRRQGGIGDASAGLVNVIFFALTIVLVSCTFAQSPDNARDKHTDKLDKLIDAVASRNKEPKIVKIDKNHRTRRIGSSDAYDIIQSDEVPVFSTDYDWADQERVLIAIMELVKKDGDELWPRLVEHIGDQRYSVTCAEQDDTVHNWDVGNICRHIALIDVHPYLGSQFEKFADHTPISNNSKEGKIKEELPGEGMFNWMLWKQISLENLKPWYHERKGKPLYELQIERCEWVIKEWQDEKRETKAVKDLFIEPVKKMIQSLKETKKPILREDPSLPFVFDPRFFDAKMAKELRDDYEAQQKAEAEKAKK